jgi:uncharacterized protein (DUF58 family)
MIAIAIIVALIALYFGWSAAFRAWVVPSLSAEFHIESPSIPFGGVTDLVIVVRNDARLPAPFVRSTIDLPPGLALVDPDNPAAQSHFAAIPLSLHAREEITVRVPLRGVKRGLYEVQTYSMMVSDGLSPNRPLQRIEGVATVVVHPAIRGQARQPLRHGATFGQQSAPRREFATSLDWINMRSYQSGDSVRDIAWRQSARAGELIVLERSITMRHEMSIFVNAQVFREHWQGTLHDVVEAVYEEALRTVLAVPDDVDRLTVYANASRRDAHAYEPICVIHDVGTARARSALGHALGMITPYAHAPFATILRAFASQRPVVQRILVVSAYEDEEIDAALKELERLGHAVTIVRVASQTPISEAQAI